MEVELANARREAATAAASHKNDLANWQVRWIAGNVAIRNTLHQAGLLLDMDNWGHSWPTGSLRSLSYAVYEKGH